MNDPVIQVEGLSKRYRIGQRRKSSDTFADAVGSWLIRPLKKFAELRALSRVQGASANLVWALRDVSFNVNRGEIVGIIGRNGAGKSTLLKILSRITPPTEGRALIQGRISSLLEVGTGFHPDLTGMENVYLNGAILGMLKSEIDKRREQIIEFSGVGEFIDTPIKRYSSGMKVRLAFSVAAHLEPEILIIDEVLAVGDAQFQRKCLGKMNEAATRGRTVLFVSHNLAAVESLCSRVIALENGTVLQDGETSSVIRTYLSELADKDQPYGSFQLSESAAESLGQKPHILSASARSTKQLSPGVFPVGEAWEFQVIYRLPQSEVVFLGIGVNHLGRRVTTLSSQNAPSPSHSLQRPGVHCFRCVTEPVHLAPGEYTVKLALGRADDGQSFHELEDALSIRVETLGAEEFGVKRVGGILLMRQTWSHEEVGSTAPSRLENRNDSNFSPQK